MIINLLKMRMMHKLNFMTLRIVVLILIVLPGLTVKAHNPGNTAANVEAWSDADASHSINYHGNPAKKFKSQYTPATGSCLETAAKTFVIVVTNIF
jgi:hypothetical protein